MFDTLHILFAEQFMKLQDEGKDGWILLKLYVPYQLLNELYAKFMKDGIPAIETLTQSEKQKYFDISCKYYSTTHERIKASKAAYVLSLITSS